MTSYKAKIYVDLNAEPKFCPVPYSMKTKVEKELECLEIEGTIEPVHYAEWEVPIVSILKPDEKALRLCGDFKVTVNKASKMDSQR